MASNFDQQDHAYEFFVAEAPELLQILESGLLALSQDSSTAQVHELMRTAHSIKGGAASVGLEAIKTLAHRLEDYLKALYSEAAVVDDNLQSMLLQAFDCLKIPLQSQLEMGTFDGEQALAAAEPIFESIEVVLGDALAASENFIPSSEDLGIDIASSIFEVDVAEGLNRLKVVLASPTDYEVAGELRAQTEVFSGFAELIGLKGFREICQVTTTALDRAPDRVLQILALAVADFEVGRDAVLGGDRSVGGTPSSDLLALATGGATSNDNPESSAADSAPLDVAVDGSEVEDIFGMSATEESSIEEEVVSLAAAPLEDIADNIFGEIATDASMDGDGLDDIFGAMSEEGTSEGDRAATASVPPEELVDSVFEDIVADDSADEDGLDEIFGAIAEEQTPEPVVTPEVTVHAEEAAEVFGNIEAAADAADRESEDLDEIFGGAIAEALAPAETPETAGDKAEAFSDPLPEATAEADASDLETPPQSTSAPQLPIEAALQKLKVDIAELPQDILAATTKDGSQQQPVTPTSQHSGPSTNAPSPQKSAPKVVRPTVRVEIERLDLMGNQVGELSIMQNSLALQNAQLQSAIRELQRRSRLFQTYVKQVRAVADDLAVDSEGFGKLNAASSSTAIDGQSWSESGFDSLEMDRYSTLYSSLQTLLEESAQLEEASDDVVLYSRQSNQSLGRQQQQLEQLRDELTWARMLPLNNVLQRFPRTVHEMGSKFGKRVNLTLDGTGVLVDKSVLEKIYDPLLHLMRNAFDHGIEPPAARAQAGKPEQGTIAIRAYHQGSETVIEMSDDGRGIDPKRIRQKAISLGLGSAERLQQISDERIVEFLFEPGFSTADSVSELSGRGMGLDVVKVQLRELKGKVSISSALGKGTTFTLRLPLTLTMTKLLVCMTESSAVAFSSDNIEEVKVPSPQEIQVTGGKRYLVWRDRLVVIRPLSSLMGYACPMMSLPDSQALKPIETPEDWARPLLVVKLGTEYSSIEVDRLVTEQELAVKPFGAAMSPPTYLYGCTVMADGTLVPVVDAISLLDSTEHSSSLQDSILSDTSSGGDEQTQYPQRQVSTLLIVDDSVAQRRSLIQSCQRAGYRVLQASNGQEALSQLEQASRVDGIICDIEMPKMNGFEFLTVRRQKPEFARIPITMLTSRSSQKHRQLAMQLGANAYLTKPYLEQELLSTLRSICDVTSPATVSP